MDIVQPDVLFLGQKDYQQYMVLSRLVEHYQLPLKIEICPTLREIDGLAMSSRNMRLSPTERIAATKLSQAIFHLKNEIKTQTIPSLIEDQIKLLQQDELIKVDYLTVVNGANLKPIKKYIPNLPITILIAANVGEIRLIDNVIVQ